MWGSVPWASPAGEDPLDDRRYDLDSVAGVLKLYFRGLNDPLFPIDSTNQLLEHARECERGWDERRLKVRSSFAFFDFLFYFSEIKNEAERAAQLKAVISSFPEPAIIVMRYLFAFLHQWVFELPSLAEYENASLQNEEESNLQLADVLLDATDGWEGFFFHMVFLSDMSTGAAHITVENYMFWHLYTRQLD